MIGQKKNGKIDKTEAPKDFIAVPKIYKGYNICRDCDARSLCQENKDNWCRQNRCMGYEATGDDGTVYKRQDGCSVLFKKK